MPDYIKSKRAPIANETFLKKWYIKTTKQYSWASIYKNNKWEYFYVDKNHKWTSAHIEVFDSKWNHLWEANPTTWIINYSKVDKDKKLPKSLR